MNTELPNTEQETGGQYQGRPLYDFAYVHDIDTRLKELADLAEEEEWEYSTTKADRPNPVLYYYFHYTFERIIEQDKTVEAEDGSHICFNTGLVTEHQEEIFALFSKNQAENREPWRFVRFCRRGEYDLTRFPELPEMAGYFEDPSYLVFDPRLELRVNVDHIIGENRERFPEPYRSHDDHTLQMLLTGAIENAKKRVRRSYKAAVPQYYRGRIQLLLPLCLSDPKIADLALIVQRYNGFYRAITCITLDMAYINARQIARPDRDWLRP
jgi:hypothetical protein